MLLDDLDHPLRHAGPAQRAVSLVPSLAGTLAVTVPGALPGAAGWRAHPADLGVPRVRGTKAASPGPGTP